MHQSSRLAASRPSPACCAPPAQAQSLAEQTDLKIVVNFPPGGAADQIARAVGAAAAGRRWASRSWSRTAPAPAATSAATRSPSRRPTATRC